MQVIFLKFLSSPGSFSHIFAIANQLAGFSISRLVSVEDFFNVCFLNVNIYVSINDYLFKYIYLVCYLKLRFYCLTYSAMSATAQFHNFTILQH